MNGESAQDRSVVLAVVMLLGLFGTVGLCGTIWLVHDHVEASAVAIVSTLTGTAIGGLVALLASTRSAPSAPVQAQQAEGYAKAVQDVQAFAAPPVAPVVAPDPP